MNICKDHISRNIKYLLLLQLVIISIAIRSNAQNCISSDSDKYTTYVRQFSNSNFDINYTITRTLVGPVTGNFYVFINADSTSSSVNTGIIKYDLNGTEVWAKSYLNSHMQYSPTISQDEQYLYYIIIGSHIFYVRKILASNGSNDGSSLYTFSDLKCKDNICHLAVSSQGTLYVTGTTNDEFHAVV